jgi:hypothetical protein
MLTVARVQDGLVRGSPRRMCSSNTRFTFAEGIQPTNLLELRGAADCLTLCAASNGCLTLVPTDELDTSKVRNAAKAVI